MQAQDPYLSPDHKRDLDLGTLLRLFWDARFILASAAVTGAVLGGLTSLLRQPHYFSRFVIDVDSSSLPAIVDGDELALKLNQLGRSFQGQSQLLQTIYKLKGDEKEKLGLILDILADDLESYTKNYVFSKKDGKAPLPQKTTDQLVDFVPNSEASSIVANLRMKEGQFGETLGRDFVRGLNQVVDTYNSKELADRELLNRSRFLDQKALSSRSAALVLPDLDRLEADAIATRSRLAAMEYELSSVARALPSVTQNLAFSYSYGVIASSGRNSELKADVRLDDRVFDLETRRLGQVIQIVAALKSESRISEADAARLQKELSNISATFKRVQSELAAYKAFDDGLSAQLGELSKQLHIDRAKFALPRFKLNELYYESLLSSAKVAPKKAALERLTYKRPLSFFVGIGLVVGGCFGFLLIFVRFFVRLDNFRTKVETGWPSSNQYPVSGAQKAPLNHSS